MAARGFVHSAAAFQRCWAGDKVIGCLVPCARAKRLRCRLLSFHKPCRGDGPVCQRGMASTPVPISSLAGQPSSRTRYEESIVTLNSLQSNAETIRKSIQNRSETRKHNIPNMVNYLQRIGLSVEDVDNLNVVHVTGTKGKGSTCAFSESILRHYGYKTGIFSSPHLIEARERIRINGRPVDRELFSTSFWHVYEKLMTTKEENNGLMPHYFGFLTVMAFYIFVREKVDVAFLEVGIGGEYDSTNVVEKPVVCGISSLDIDHTNLLGHTLEDIAWHKAGIFKKGAPGITVPQPESPLSVILSRAKERGCPVYLAAPLAKEELSVNGFHLGIAGDRQRYNAALAIQLCRVWLDQHNKSFEERVLGCEDQSDVLQVSSIPQKYSTQLSQEMIEGLAQCQWPGRTQTISRPGVTYYLDGAHTTDSMQQCVEWFQQVADKEKRVLGGRVCRALVFNMTGDRPVSVLLKPLKGCGFHMAAFCPNIVSTTASENIPDQMNLTVEQETIMKKSVRNCKTWEDLFAGGDAQSPSALINSSLITVNEYTPTDASATEHVNGHAATNTNFSSGTPIINGSSHSGNPTAQDMHMASPDADVLNGTPDTLAVKSQNGASETLPDAVSPPPQCKSVQFPCIASALRWATQNQDTSFLSAVSLMDENLNGNSSGDTDEVPHIQVLVTGSLHLVGGVLELLTPDMYE